MIPYSVIYRSIEEPAFVNSGALLAWIVATSQPDAIRLAEHPGMQRMRDALKPKAEILGGVAVLPIDGILARKPDPWEMAFYGVEDSSAVLDMVNEAASNPDVKGILLSIDSPGGYLTGGPEIAQAVKAAAKEKPVVAWTGGSMASLAYWIGSQASEVISSPSASVGSIGVYMALADFTKAYEAMGIKVDVIKNKEGTFKAAGLPGTAMTPDQRSHFESKVQASFSEFSRSVKSARPDATAESMQGQTFNGREAKAAGLVDRVGDKSFALGVLRQMIRAKG